MASMVRQKAKISALTLMGYSIGSFCFALRSALLLS